MVDLEKRAKPIMIIDYEEDEKEVPSSHQKEKKEEKPKPKSAPAAMEEKAKAQIEKVPTTKKMPKFPEKSKHEEGDSKVEMKKVKEATKPWEEYYVPKEHLSVKVSQHVWSQLGAEGAPDECWRSVLCLPERRAQKLLLRYYDNSSSEVVELFQPTSRRTKTIADRILLVLLAVQYEDGEQKTKRLC